MTQPNPYPQQPQPGYGQQPYPQQQAPKKKSKKTWIFLGIAALVVIGVAVNGGGEDEPNTGSADTAAVGSADGAAVQNVDDAEGVGIGQAARDGEFEFIVNGVSREKTVGDQYVNATAQGEYVILDMTITNIGSEPQMLSDSSQYVYDAQGSKFEADSEAGWYLNGVEGASVWLEDINPGNSITGKMAFDMPAGAEPVSAELHDSAFSGGVTVSLK